jgi:hypothetical protein
VRALEKTKLSAGWSNAIGSQHTIGRGVSYAERQRRTSALAKKSALVWLMRRLSSPEKTYRRLLSGWYERPPQANHCLAPTLRTVQYGEREGLWQYLGQIAEGNVHGDIGHIGVLLWAPFEPIPNSHVATRQGWG